MCRSSNNQIKQDREDMGGGDCCSGGSSRSLCIGWTVVTHRRTDNLNSDLTPSTPTSSNRCRSYHIVCTQRPRPAYSSNIHRVSLPSRLLHWAGAADTSQCRAMAKPLSRGIRPQSGGSYTSSLSWESQPGLLDAVHLSHAYISGAPETHRLPMS